jgi:hypothetical protein
MSKRPRKFVKNNSKIEESIEAISQTSYGTQRLQEKASKNTSTKFSQMLSHSK